MDREEEEEDGRVAARGARVTGVARICWEDGFSGGCWCVDLVRRVDDFFGGEDIGDLLVRERGEMLIPAGCSVRFFFPRYRVCR